MIDGGIALAALSILIVLLAVRVPLALAMLVVGMGGYVALAGMAPLLGYLKSAAYWRFASYDLAVIPMFVLMGQFASESGMSSRLFTAASAFLGHRRGGIAMAAVGACGAFGAICGSSLAIASTMSRVALPELKRYGYSGALATGAVAAGGTLGILIPPSVVLVVYAVAVEANIVRLFEAALIPGLLAMFGFLLTIAIYVRIVPSAGPKGPRASGRERWRALVSTAPILLLFLIVIGGIYLGVFDPTEAAAVGAAGAAVLAGTSRALGIDALRRCLLSTASTTAMIFSILLGADLLNAFLALAGFPEYVAGLSAGSGLDPYVILGLVIVFYLVLGCLMDSLAMILLTVPIFWPVISVLDFGLTVPELQMWFGIIVLVVVELGLMTPPVGINVLVINANAPGVSLRESFAGTLPFVLCGIVQLAVLVAFPAITLFLPRLLG